MTTHISLALLTTATLETIVMVGVSTLIAIVIGTPLGLILFTTQRGGIFQNIALNKLLGTVVNITRSIPFIILMIAIIPFTRLIIGTTIGTAAAMVPLAIAAIPYMGRVVENALKNVNPGLIEAGLAMGATPWQSMNKVLLAEAQVPILNGTTLMMINLIGYSAMAGAVGGGGLGNVAISYGYQRFDVTIMLATVIILVLIVHMVQWLGDYIAKRLTH